MRVTFVLPGAGNIPVGGFKIVYEYANHLTAKGHEVSVLHAARADKDAALASKLKAKARYVQRRVDKSYRPDWLALDPKVKLLWRETPAAGGVPEADAVIATAWQTAEWVADYPKSKGKGFYLVQHYETWSGPKDRVDATFTLGLHHLAIARWLQEIIEAHGGRSSLTPNGLDFRTFALENPIETREPRLMMLYHSADWKGSADGIKALKIIKEASPEAQAILFGTPERPQDLPAWIRYERRPTTEFLRQLYNESALFLAPSWTEGWGLPACEAMMCGCALIATDTGGHREFAFDGETARLVPIKSPEMLAEVGLELLADHSQRQSLAYSGHAFIQRFTWSAATARLETILNS